MVLAKKILVEVAYATPEQQTILVVQIKENTTIEDAIIHSGILQIFPEIDLTRQKVGVFSKQKAATDLMQENDRIEIYRPLLMDPKEARKKRAKKILLDSIN